MTIATALCASLLCVSVCAAAEGRAAPVISCNLKAIGAADRLRYNDLMMRLRAAVRNRSELSNGFAFTLDGKVMDLPQVAEWIRMERRCCPFLRFQLYASGDKADWLLTLTGPKGVKTLLQLEFPSD